MRTVAVIGGGASGMMGAVTGASRGGRGVILGHKKRGGEKNLVPGKGNSNFKNKKEGPAW